MNVVIPNLTIAKRKVAQETAVASFVDPHNILYYPTADF